MILGFKSRKQNKSVISKWYLFASVVFACAVMVMSKIHYIGSVWGGLDKNYLDNFGKITDILFLFVIPICYVSLVLLEKLMVYLSNMEKYVPDQCKNRVILITAIILLLAWLPYFLSYYPGGIYSDTFASIRMVLSGDIRNNHHPILYTFCIKIVIWIGNHFGKDLNWSLGLFLFLQMTALGGTILYFEAWLLKHKINKYVIGVSMLYLIFFPLIPLNAISIWKDTPFSIVLFLYVLCLIDLYLDVRREQINYKLIVVYAVLSILVAFTRNNGLYIIFGTAVIYIFVTIRQYQLVKYKQRIYAAMIASILAVTIIQGPIYHKMGIVQTEFVENVSIPLQQIGRTVALDGNVTKKQKKELNKFIPYENIKTKYVPCLVDSLKWGSDLNNAYLETHKGEFFKLYFQLLVQNPKIYVDAYIMDTAGFWCVNVAGLDAYVQNYVWQNDLGVAQTDYLKKWTGLSLQNIVNPKHAISSALFFWMMFFSMIVVAKKRSFKDLVLYMPLFLLWITIMIAVPLAVSMRYVFGLVLMAPLFVIVPMMMLHPSNPNDR